MSKLAIIWYTHNTNLYYWRRILLQMMMVDEIPENRRQKNTFRSEIIPPLHFTHKEMHDSSKNWNYKISLAILQLVRTYMLLKGEFAVVLTDKICERSLSSKIPVDMNSIFMKLYVTWPTWPRSHTSEIWSDFCRFQTDEEYHF